MNEDQHAAKQKQKRRWLGEVSKMSERSSSVSQDGERNMVSSRRELVVCVCVCGMTLRGFMYRGLARWSSSDISLNIFDPDWKLLTGAKGAPIRTS